MAYIENLTSGDPDILLQLNEHLNLDSHRAAVGTFVKLEQCWFWIVLVSVAGRSVSQGISKRGQWNFKVSWSILSSCRKPTNMVFLNVFSVWCKGIQTWQLRERLDLDVHWPQDSKELHESYPVHCSEHGVCKAACSCGWALSVSWAAFSLQISLFCMCWEDTA